MSKKINLGAAIVLMLLAVLITFQITYVSIDNKYERKMNELTTGQLQYEKLANVDEVVRKIYINPIEEDVLMDNIVRGYVSGIGDKYATYMNSEQYAAYMKDANAELEGIGVYIIFNNDYNAIEIVSVMPNSPALTAGIQPGDLIYAVEGEEVATTGYYAAYTKLQGKAGTVIHFSVARGENYAERIEFNIECGYVNEQTVLPRRYLDTDIGIIKILSFDNGTPAQFIQAVESLQKEGVTQFVFDVRYNPGGALDSVSAVLDYLLPAGPIIRMVDRNGKEEVISSDAKELATPMVVLVNGNTASAGELFASALKDYEKAKLVGKKTYGKGTMQSVMRLPDNSAISISIKKYYPPYSDNFEGVGVLPDEEVDMPPEVSNKNIYKITDEEDAQLQRAIALLQSGASQPATIIP